MKRLVICLFAAGLLSACQTDSTPAARRAPAAKPDPQALVAAVRAAGEHGVELEVAPLRDPHVEDLLAMAQSHEAAGRARAGEGVRPLGPCTQVRHEDDRRCQHPPN